MSGPDGERRPRAGLGGVIGRCGFSKRTHPRLGYRRGASTGFRDRARHREAFGRLPGFHPRAQTPPHDLHIEIAAHGIAVACREDRGDGAQDFVVRGPAGSPVLDGSEDLEMLPSVLARV